jgi:hypothetical protein
MDYQGQEGAPLTLHAPFLLRPRKLGSCVRYRIHPFQSSPEGGSTQSFRCLRVVYFAVQARLIYLYVTFFPFNVKTK